MISDIYCPLRGPASQDIWHLLAIIGMGWGCVATPGIPREHSLDRQTDIAVSVGVSGLVVEI
jgi:hypothetical protein